MSWILIAEIPIAYAQDSPITAGETVIENNFPEGATFRTKVESAAGEITSAKLILAFQNAVSSSEFPLQVQPSRILDLEHAWDTSQTTVPPSTPVYYSWEVSDSAGNRYITPEKLFHYDDVRFNWRVIDRGNLSVWWHDQADGFGEEVYSLATRALEEQSELFQSDLEFPIRLIIYNDFEEFAEWHSFVGEYVGGQAFPPLGITTQIVPDEQDQTYWLQAVIPHEISHLYFYQATESGLPATPAWLNEGIAQFNEFIENEPALRQAREAALSGNLLRLNGLTGSFGQEDDRVGLAYAESLSAVMYLVDAYGEEGMGRLMAAFREGKDANEAFEAALGRNPIEFEQDWLDWLGIPPELYPTITATPPPAAFATIPPHTFPTHSPAGTQAALLSGVAAAEAAPSRTPSPEPSRTHEAEVTPESPPGSSITICGSGLIALVVLSGVPFWRKSRRRTPGLPQ